MSDLPLASYDDTASDGKNEPSIAERVSLPSSRVDGIVKDNHFDDHGEEWLIWKFKRGSKEADACSLLCDDFVDSIVAKKESERKAAVEAKQRQELVEQKRQAAAKIVKKDRGIEKTHTCNCARCGPCGFCTHICWHFECANVVNPLVFLDNPLRALRACRRDDSFSSRVAVGDVLICGPCLWDFAMTFEVAVQEKDQKVQCHVCLEKNSFESTLPIRLATRYNYSCLYTLLIHPVCDQHMHPLAEKRVEEMNKPNRYAYS